MKKVFLELQKRLEENPPRLNLDRDATNLKNPIRLREYWDFIGLNKEQQAAELRRRGIRKI